MNRPLKTISFLIASLMLAFPASASLASLNALIRAQIVSDRSLPSQQLQFTGTKDPAIVMLRSAELGDQFIQTRFRNASWIFYPDGKFILISTQSNAPDSKKMLVSGTYSRTNNILELQGERLGKGEKVSIDGTIKLDQQQGTIDVIYSSSTAQAQRIAKVRQVLSTAPSTDSNLDRLIASNAADSETPQQAQILASNQQKVEGIILDNYEILLQGKTEAQTFNALKSQLSVRFPLNVNLPLEQLLANQDQPKNPKSIQVSLTSAEQEIKNGWMGWDSGLEAEGKPSEIEIKNGQIRMTFQSSRPNSGMYWYTIPKPVSSSNTALAYANRANLTLQFQGDRVSGKLQASGLYSFPFGDRPIYNQPSTYEAEIKGVRIKSELADQLRETLSTSSFTGQWESTATTNNKLFSNLGRLELRQIANRVQGTYTGYGGGTLNGTVEGNRLNFTWSDKQRGQGSGFLRSLTGGGTLVGQFQSATATEEVAIANWQPPQLKVRSLSEIDRRELRRLGDSLYGRGRCQQAVGLYQLLGNQYRETRRQETVGEGIADTRLPEEFGLLNSIMNCAFQVGNYDTLLNALTQAIEVQNYLAPDATARRAFRQQTRAYPEALSDATKIFATQETNLIDLQSALTSGRTGIQTSLNSTTKEIVIASVIPNSPADRAGIQAKDILTKIDERPIQGLTIEQVTAKVRGAVGTSVAITVQRDRRELQFKLVRERIAVRPKYRSEAELIQDIAFLTNYLKTAQTRFAADARDFNTLEKQITGAKADPLEALDTRSTQLDQQWQRLSGEVDTLIAASKTLLKGHNQVLQVFDQTVSALPRQRCSLNRSPLSTFDPQASAALDEQFDRVLAQNADLTDAEKYLFNIQIQTIGQINLTAFRLDCIRALIKQGDARERFNITLKDSRENLARFSELVEIWRKRLVEDTARITAQESGQPIFQSLIQLLVGMGQDKDALLVSEQSRARAFADLLATRYTSKAVESPTLEQIQRIAVRQKSTLVQYTIIKHNDKDSQLLIWVIKPTGEIFLEQVSLANLLKEESSLDDFVQSTRELILGSISAGQDATPKLKRLYQSLIQPIEHLLPSNPDAHVVFIPHGSLFLVPFSALLDENGQSLIQKHTILTAPSIQVLDSTHALASQATRGTSGALVIGNGLPLQLGEKNYPALKEAEGEAKAIASQFRTEPILNEQATKATVLRKMALARYIHISAHGQFADTGFDSWIALAPEGTDNGLLTAKEILDLKLNADLMVLSACASGRGQINGDGVIGLSRSLIAAGIPSVIVSLWSVDAESTGFLMEKFYQYLPSGKAKALRQAMLDTKARYPNQPGLWAAFTLVGES